MSYSPVELRHVEVGRSLLGYKKADVERILNDVADSFEQVWRERADLSDRNEELEAQVTQLRSTEQALTHTLVAAEHAASDMREQAKREAEVVLAEAHQEARSITRTAHGERERLFAETRRIEALLRAALGMLEGSGTAAAPASAPAPAVTPELPPPYVPARTTEAASEPVEPMPMPAPVLRHDDTREFAPIEFPVPERAVPETVAPETPEADEPTSEGAALPFLRKVVGGEARDFDWGE